MHDARERLLASFAGLPEEDMVRPGVKEAWSVRDVLANIAAWDRAITQAFRVMVSGVRPPLMDLDDEGTESFNAEHYHANQNASIDEVVTELHQAREDLIEFLKTVDNQALFAPAPGDERADYSIAACLRIPISHDEENAELIEAWREQTGK